MPKLPDAVAKREAETTKEWGQGFEPVPDGRYLARLIEVDATGNGPKGPYWTWIFEMIQTTDQPQRSKFWLNTSLSAEGSLKQVFTSLGYTTDSDTDEMLGEVACLVVSRRPIKKGPNTGKITNNVDAVLPAAEHPEYDEAEHGGDGFSSPAGAGAAESWE
jgi:hypothetical protein